MRWAYVRLFLVVGLASLVGCTNNSDQDLRWHDEGSYRWAEVSPSSYEEVGFRKLEGSETGISFTNRLTEAEISENQHYMNGSGVAAGDVDGDGWTDLYFAQLHGPNRLYKNVGGFRFRDVTDSAGVAHEGHYSTSAVFADVNGNGALDLLVGSMSKGISIYMNDGEGHFTERTEEPLEQGKGNMTIALADIDGDGDLDFYVANYKEKPVKDLFSNDELKWEKTIQKKETVEGTEYELIPPFDEHYRIIEREGKPNSRRETGEFDALYLNEGDGVFRKARNVQERFVGPGGTRRGLALDWGLNASFQDINQDGHPDLYVNNDFWTPDRVWLNQGDGTFRAIDSLAIRSSSFSSMTVDFSDFNRDGELDFFVTEMLSPVHSRRLRQFNPTDPFPATEMRNRPQYNRNSLYLNRGDGTYAEISYFSGMEATEWSWATRFLDVDLDGYDDILVNTGFSYDFQDLDSQQRIGRKMSRTVGDERFLTEYPRLRLDNKSFRNGMDLTFSERSEEWGFASEEDISHGMATADFDRDGDLDLAISRLNASALLYENETTKPRITVQLSGIPPNTQAIGAKVILKGGKGGPAPQREAVTAGGDYLSGSAPHVTFAADPSNRNHVIVVNWPDGTRSTVDSVAANRIYDIQQPESSSETVPSDTLGTEEEPIFKDVSGRISHRHHESEYDDFRIQPLLPIKLSQQGPGLSWIDYDSDGDDDLFIPSGRGGAITVYENNEAGHFTARSLGPLTETAPGDQTTILGWPTEDGAELVLGRANYEPGDINAPSARHFSIQEGTVTERQPIPGILSTTGPMAVADYDGDGDLDLFVGGRFVPARYPRDATSRLFENEAGQFVLDKTTNVLKGVGLVTGAVFTDYDGDGDPDLLLSRAWDSLALFENQGGTFRDVTTQVGLHEHTGWWNGVATGDFNNDGRPDIVATNWGTNSPYQLENDRPLKMYYQDFNGDRRIEIIEAYYDSDIGAYVPRRKLEAFQSTPVPMRAESHEEYANASLATLLGGDPNSYLSSKEINTLASTVFINEGGQFSAHALPDEAQFSAAFHVGVADYNSDGNEDLFLSQNFFEVRPQTPRHDAGRGLLLRGNGHGHFQAVSGLQSGISVYGEQRGAAFSDFNGDGRVDLAVTQNGAATTLYRNQEEKSGITIRLDGPPANRAAIGASLRLIYPDGRKGPRRTIQAGSGYWSQGSATQVLGYSQPPEQIEITWPDGQVSTRTLSEVKRAYTFEYPPQES